MTKSEANRLEPPLKRKEREKNRKRYAAPVLKKYGSITELTGGTVGRADLDANPGNGT